MLQQITALLLTVCLRLLSVFPSCPLLTATLIPGLFSKHLRRSARWHYPVSSQEGCLPSLLDVGVLGCGKWAAGTQHGEVWRPFHQKSETGLILRSLPCTKTAFVQSFYLSQYPYEAVFPWPVITGLWRSCATHGDYKVTSSSMQQILGLLFSYFSAIISSQRSPLDKPSVIIAELMFMWFPQQPSHFQFPGFRPAQCAWLKTSFWCEQAWRGLRWDAVIWPDSSWSQCNVSFSCPIHLTCIRVGFPRCWRCLQ